MLPNLFSLTSLQPFFLIKICFLLVLFLYLVFAFVVFNQTKVMNRVIEEKPFAAILQIVALLNMLLAISLFLIVTVIL